MPSNAPDTLQSEVKQNTSKLAMHSLTTPTTSAHSCVPMANKASVYVQWKGILHFQALGLSQFITRLDDPTSVRAKRR